MKLTRYKGNPILKPREENEWEAKAVFNCAAVSGNGNVHLLYRAIGEYEKYISRWGYAVSEDGLASSALMNLSSRQRNLMNLMAVKIPGLPELVIHST